MSWLHLTPRLFFRCCTASTGMVTSCALTFDGRVAVAGTADGSVLLFDTNEPAPGQQDGSSRPRAASFSTGEHWSKETR